MLDRWQKITRYSRLDLERILLLVLSYILSIKVIMQFVGPQGDASMIWLPSGLGLGLILINGWRFWPVIFLGIFSGYVLVMDRPILTSAAVALFSNTMEPLVAVWILQRMRFWGRRFDIGLNDPMDFVMLALAAMVGAAFAALAGASLLVAFGIYSMDNAGDDMLHWWMGNMLGIVLVTPLILVWRQIPNCWRGCVNGKIEMAVFLGLAFLSGQILFQGWFPVAFGHVAQGYWMFVFVCWGAIRFGLHGTLLVIVMTAIQALDGAGKGLGLFKDDYAAPHLINFWFYMLTLTLVGVLLSSVIQKRRQSEAQLSEREQRWRLALEAAGDGVWEWNMLTGKVMFSRRWKQMLGYEESEISNDFSEWSSRVHPEDLDRTLADIRSYVAGERPNYLNEHRMQCKDGNWKWILDRGMIFSKSPDGKPVSMIGTHTDITRHKLLEEALMRNEEDLRTIFSQSPDGIVVFDHKHEVSLVNEAFCRITGLAREKLVGLAEEGFDEVMQQLCGTKVKYAATAKADAIEESSFSIQIDAKPRRRASDRGVVVEIFQPEQRMLFRSLIELDQHRLSRVMYFRDITAEAMVDRMKSEFLSTAAHELRTPMSIILGYAELLKMRTFDQDAQTRMVDSIHDQSQSIVVLLNELLDLARIEARAGKAFNMMKLPLAPVITQIADSFMMAGDARKVKLLPLPALPELMIDEEKIGQALKNCLSNAFKFSGKDSEVSLEARLDQNGDQQTVSIIVRDHGIGMSAQELARMFEKFYRADTSGKTPGTGLGMSLIKEIIEHHGGHVHVASEPGKGTVVTLVLPIVKKEEIQS